MADPEDTPDESRVATASRDIAAGAAKVFELIADPEQQPRWDGNDTSSGPPRTSGSARSATCSS